MALANKQGRETTRRLHLALPLISNNRKMLLENFLRKNAVHHNRLRHASSDFFEIIKEVSVELHDKARPVRRKQFVWEMAIENDSAGLHFKNRNRKRYLIK